MWDSVKSFAQAQVDESSPLLCDSQGKINNNNNKPWKHSLTQLPCKMSQWHSQIRSSIFTTWEERRHGLSLDMKLNHCLFVADAA